MHSRRTFDGIIFDMGDILYDASTWRRWLSGELQSHGIEITYPQLVEHWERLLVDVYRGAADYWERFEELLQTIGLPSSSTAPVTEAARQKAMDVQVGRKPMAGVPETLAKLRSAGVRMAVLSDTESGESKVRALLRELGIEEYFDAVVTSADIGFAKPDPKAFSAAVVALGLPTKQCAFVGHDIDELEGAQQAGLFAVAYNYHPGAPADFRVDRFNDLMSLARSEYSSTQ